MFLGIFNCDFFLKNPLTTHNPDDILIKPLEKACFFLRFFYGKGPWKQNSTTNLERFLSIQEVNQRTNKAKAKFMISPIKQCDELSKKGHHVASAHSTKSNSGCAEGSSNFFREFDPGSGWTLAACLTHASRTKHLARGRGVLAQIGLNWDDLVADGWVTRG